MCCGSASVLVIFPGPDTILIPAKCFTGIPDSNNTTILQAQACFEKKEVQKPTAIPLM